MFGITFAFGLTLTGLLLAAGHWFPWPKRLQRMRTLDEAEILTELNAGRVAVIRAKTNIAKLHPDRLVETAAAGEPYNGGNT